MPKLSRDALRTRITELQKQLAAVEASKGPAVKQVKALMKKLGVTADDLTAENGGKRRGRPAKSAASEGAAKGGSSPKTRKARGEVAIKYRDDQGNTWTGRGKTPRWLVEAEKAGAKRESFLIK